MRPDTRVMVALGGVVAAVLIGLIVARPGYWALAAGGVVAAAFVGLALVRPRWALLAAIGFPPGLIALITAKAGITLYFMVAVIVTAIAVFLFGGRRVGDRGLALGYGVMFALMLASYLRHDVPNAVSAAGSILSFAYYGAVYLLVLNLAPKDAGESTVFVERVHVAVLVSVLATGAIAVAQMGTQFVTTLDVRLFPEDAGLLFSRTHFGYFVALGLAVALPRWAERLQSPRTWVVLTAVTAVLVLLSVARGSWVAGLLLMALVALASKRWVLALSAPLLWLIGQIPGIQSRLSSDFSGGALLALQSGAAGSNRLLLWGIFFAVAMRSPVFGHGFGFVSSLSPAAYFGEGQFVSSQNVLVYAHNDFLYLFLELGLVGLVPYVLGLGSWWWGALRRLPAIWGATDRRLAAQVLTCVGFGLIALVAQSVDNGFFIRAVFERFAVGAATMALTGATVGSSARALREDAKASDG